MTITDAIPRLLALDGLVLPDGRVFGCEDRGHHYGVPSAALWLRNGRESDYAYLEADRTLVYDDVTAAFLLMDVVEAIRQEELFSLNQLWGVQGGGYAYCGTLTDATSAPTRIEAVLETALRVMEQYKERQNGHKG